MSLSYRTLIVDNPDRIALTKETLLRLQREQFCSVDKEEESDGRRTLLLLLLLHLPLFYLLQSPLYIVSIPFSLFPSSPLRLSFNFFFCYFLYMFYCRLHFKLRVIHELFKSSCTFISRNLSSLDISIIM